MNMMTANQNDPNQFELDPTKARDGLGFFGYIRLVFRTRAATIKQCDAMVLDLLRQLDAAARDAEQYKNAYGKFGQLIVAQNAALNTAQPIMFNAGWHTHDDQHPERKQAYDLVVSAIHKGLEPL